MIQFNRPLVDGTLLNRALRGTALFVAVAWAAGAIGTARAIEIVVRAVAADSALVDDAAVNDAPEMEEDDLVEEAPAQMQFARPTMTDEMFEQWVFNSVGNAQAAALRFDSMLIVQAETVANVCGMTPQEKEKLLLAGRGDIARFFERVEVSRKKFQLVKNDQNRINEVFQDIQPLQMTVNAGLFNDGSFFQKVVKKSLNAEQRKKLDQAERDRRIFQYKAKIELVVSALDDSIALRAEQRKQLTEMLLKTSPPKQFGQYDFYVVMFRLSRLPEEKLGQLFDGAQRRALDRQLDQVRGLEPFLKQQGLLPDDEPPAEKPARANPRADKKK